jgi:hypothetical protein
VKLTLPGFATRFLMSRERDLLTPEHLRLSFSLTIQGNRARTTEGH